VGGLDITKLTKIPLTYSVSRFNFGGFGVFLGGAKPTKALRGDGTGPRPRLHQKLRDSRLEVRDRDRDSRLQNLCILPKFFKKMLSSRLTMGIRRGGNGRFPPLDWN